ncbi:uncharacterized protein SOCE26_048320 [Sorangium cellulosum]|uniref:Secreted protein n=1 Tax=Sorangium cellulosum TaxID=56 RepID=A0A2L0EVR4_SORCE|nr:hypothetical protein [Sorangium cellulosum]AUX43384.1 uncharacterized protein SOCE26_048320 [Sorangium cellulosum]
MTAAILPLAAALALLAGCSTSKPDPAGTQAPAPTSTSTPTPTQAPTEAPIVGVPAAAIPGHADLQDHTPKQGPRVVPAEVFLQSYLRFFGDDLTPLEVEAIARGDDAGSVFDRWADYQSSLGLPDYKLDVSRQAHTNTLMLATFERLGIALCVRKAEVELRSSPPPPAIAARRVFAFDMTPAPPTDAEFAERFDVLHRTFLGYPAALAPTDRTSRFRAVFRDILARRTQTGAPASRFSPQQAAWSAVCYGLVRHPEFVLY